MNAGKEKVQTGMWFVQMPSADRMINGNFSKAQSTFYVCDATKTRVRAQEMLYCQTIYFCEYQQDNLTKSASETAMFPRRGRAQRKSGPW